MFMFNYENLYYLLNKILTIDSNPALSCFSLKLSSGKATPPYILHSPVPSPCKYNKQLKTYFDHTFYNFKTDFTKVIVI